MTDDDAVEVNFNEEYLTRLRHFGVYFSASTAQAYHIFFKKLPDSHLTLQVQNSTSIFVVWSIDAPANDILLQAKDIRASEINLADTTASICLVPPRKVKTSFTKNSLKTANGELWGIQYIFPWEVETEEFSDDAW